MLSHIKIFESQMALLPVYQHRLPLSKITRYRQDFVPYCKSHVSLLCMYFIRIKMTVVSADATNILS